MIYFAAYTAAEIYNAF